MPWFPDFANAVARAGVEPRAAARADPVAAYFAALNEGDADGLETGWPGDVVVYDPRAGEVRGHRQLQAFVRQNQAWMAAHGAHTETVAATAIDGRAVVELLARLDVDGSELEWPVAVVAESTDDESVVFRTYCSQVPVDGRRHLRPPILEPAATRPDGVVGRYLDALAAGDTEAVVSTFVADGYLREPLGADSAHRGTSELHSYFTRFFSDGGVGLEQCVLTDDGVRCALEYNWRRWGSHDLPPQAGLGVCERTTDGLLAAVRLYDDVEAPFAAPI
jgi:ketosteroid isomerase-like protein